MTYGPPEQPQYGQQQPGYGQQQPDYGQPSGYDQPYGAQGHAPGYGAQAPGYGEAPGYGQAPGYGGQMQPYGAAGYGYGQTTSDERSWALMGHLGQLLLGFIAPLLVFLIKKDESAFLRHHGAQGLNLAISQFVYLIVNSALSIVTLGIWLIPTFALGVMQIVYLILAAVAGNRGEWYRFPSFMAWPMIK